MGRSTVVSVRIPKKLKDRLSELGVNISEVVRRLLEDYVREAELRELSRLLDELRARLAGKVNSGLVASVVRESREAR